MSFLQAPWKAFVENTERGPRVLRAFSLARVVRRNFPRIRKKRLMQKAVGWVRVLVGGGVLRVYAAVCRATRRRIPEPPCRGKRVLRPMARGALAGRPYGFSLKPVPTNCATSRPVSSETSTFTTQELRPSLR